MNKIFPILLCLVLAACFEVPVEENTIAPKSTRVEPLSAEQVLKENSSEALRFEPIPNSRIRFFDAQGRLMESGVKGGFYRKVLGRTPHNRLVLQDFYQDNDKPYTLPFVAVADAQLKIFNGAAVRDSRTVWLQPDGSVARVSEFRNGKAVGESWFYHRNNPFAYIKLLNDKPKKTDVPIAASAASAVNASEPVVAIVKKNKPVKSLKKINKPIINHSSAPEEPDRSLSQGAALMYFFYPNGVLMAEIETDGNKQNKITLYYPNSATMMQIEDDGSQSSRAAWDAKGQKVTPSDVSVEADVLALRIEYGLNLMGRGKGVLAELLSQ